MDAVFHTEFHSPGDFAATGARDMSFAGLGGDNSNTPPGLFSFPQVEAPSPPTAPGPTPGLFRRLVAARVSGLAGLPRVPHNFGSDTMRDLGVSMEDRRQLRATVAELEFTYARLDVLEYQACSLERLIDEQLEPYLAGEPAGGDEDEEEEEEEIATAVARPAAKGSSRDAEAEGDHEAEPQSPPEDPPVIAQLEAPPRDKTPRDPATPKVAIRSPAAKSPNKMPVKTPSKILVVTPLAATVATPVKTPGHRSLVAMPTATSAAAAGGTPGRGSLTVTIPPRRADRGEGPSSRPMDQAGDGDDEDTVRVDLSAKKAKKKKGNKKKRAEKKQDE